MARFGRLDWVLFGVAALFVIVGLSVIMRPEELTLLQQRFPAGAPRPLTFFQMLSPSTIRIYGVIAVAAGCGLAVSLVWITRKM